MIQLHSGSKGESEHWSKKWFERRPFLRIAVNISKNDRNENNDWSRGRSDVSDAESTVGFLTPNGGAPVKIKWLGGLRVKPDPYTCRNPLRCTPDRMTALARFENNWHCCPTVAQTVAKTVAQRLTASDSWG